METRDYIETGDLELYVFGLLDDAENTKISQMARNHKEVEDEISAIEEAIISLSAGFSPELSPDRYQAIGQKLELKFSQPEHIAVQEPNRRTRPIWGIVGWAAALAFLLGAGYLFYEWQSAKQASVAIQREFNKKEIEFKKLTVRQQQAVAALVLMRDSKNAIVTLYPQPVSPEASARIYWNRETQQVTIDASSLPEPQGGYVYQAWAIYYKPFNAVSIGLLENGSSEDLFALHSTSQADAFGVTLEPPGGSETPTLEQLYVIGKTN